MVRILADYHALRRGVYHLCVVDEVQAEREDELKHKIPEAFKKFLSKAKDIEMDKIPCPACGGQTKLLCALCIGEGYIYQPKKDDDNEPT